jgi:glycosyltransferase involved in cell wall biosynthesis
MQSLISIIVTSYNHSTYLDQRMVSLLNQTYSNSEIIVVDDCSSDDSAQVLRKYLDHPRVRIVELDRNRGYAYASNLGVSLAHGDYILFAESDDYSEPMQVETLLRSLAEHDTAGVAYSRSTMINSSGHIAGNDFQGREKDFRDMCARDVLIPSRQMRLFFLVACVIPNMSAALIRRDCFNRAGGLSPSYRACADWDFWCRMAELTDFYYITTPLNNFRTHPKTVRGTMSIKVQLLEMYQLLYTAYEKMELDQTERRRFKINTGALWANFIPLNPLSWIISFPSILRETMRFDRLTVLYLMVIMIKRAGILVQWICSKAVAPFRQR